MSKVKELFYRLPCLLCGLSERVRSKRVYGEKVLDRFLWAIPLFITFTVWEITVRLGFLSTSVAPPPSRVIVTLANCIGNIVFLQWILQSLLNITLGILLALSTALPLAIVTGLKNRVDHTLTPTIMICGALPDLAVLPLFVFWFGPGTVAAILMAMICSFFPIFFSVREGVREIPLDYFHVANIFKAGRLATLTKMILPAVFPKIISGVRIAFEFVWEIILFIEIIARVAGIGSFIEASMQQGSVELVFAGILAVSFLVLTIDQLIFMRAEKKIMKWI